MAVEFGVANDGVEFGEAAEVGAGEFVERVEEEAVDDEGGVEAGEVDAEEGDVGFQGASSGDTHVVGWSDGEDNEGKEIGLDIAEWI